MSNIGWRRHPPVGRKQMRYYAVPLLLGVLFSLPVPLSGSYAQQTPADRDCDAGAARRQLMGQPMTDFLAACRAARVNPENLQTICANNADAKKLSGAARNTYLRECTTGPD
jgi:hypothetical protein